MCTGNGLKYEQKIKRIYYFYVQKVKNVLNDVKDLH